MEVELRVRSALKRFFYLLALLSRDVLVRCAEMKEDRALDRAGLGQGMRHGRAVVRDGDIRIRASGDEVCDAASQAEPDDPRPVLFIFRQPAQMLERVDAVVDSLLDVEPLHV